MRPKDSLGISLPVAHVAGDHVEFEISFNELEKLGLSRYLAVREVLRQYHLEDRYEEILQLSGWWQPMRVVTKSSRTIRRLAGDEKMTPLSIYIILRNRLDFQVPPMFPSTRESGARPRCA